MRRGRKSHQVQRGLQYRRGPGGGVPRGGTRGLCLRPLGVGHGGRGAGEKAVVMEKAGENGHGWFLCLQQASTRCPRAWQVTGVTRAWPNQPAASTSVGIPLARHIPNRSWIFLSQSPRPAGWVLLQLPCGGGTQGGDRLPGHRASKGPVDRAAQGLGAGPGSPCGARGRGGGWGRLRSTSLSGGPWTWGRHVFQGRVWAQVSPLLRP